MLIRRGDKVFDVREVNSSESGQLPVTEQVPMTAPMADPLAERSEYLIEDAKDRIPDSDIRNTIRDGEELDLNTRLPVKEHTLW